MFALVQVEDFNQGELYARLKQSADEKASGNTGAIVTFTGLVRDFNNAGDIDGIELEHYPGMTEKALGEICDEAEQRWPLLKIRVIHRVGDLDIGDQIVFVGVSSAHRGAAFEACEFVMDYLKTKAPFWKKERTSEVTRWVDSRDSDAKAAERWKQK